MLSTWLMIGGIILIVVIVMKVSSAKQEWAIRIVMFLFIFIMLTVGYVYVTDNPKIDGPSSIVDFAKTYFIWLGSAFGNVKETTGYFSQQDWSINDNNTKS